MVGRGLREELKATSWTTALSECGFLEMGARGRRGRRPAAVWMEGVGGPDQAES
jgi:hypothetical protein